MNDRVSIADLHIAHKLHDFVDNEVAPDLGLDTVAFWRSFSEILTELSPVNQKLLLKRDSLQTQIDEWHREHRSTDIKTKDYKHFLESIGYLEQDCDPCVVSTQYVDDEIALVAAPQLVVPVNNARYALNAANARWGSLYDAIYASDIISDSGSVSIANAYNPERGQQVIAIAMQFLDDTMPLETGSYNDVKAFEISKEHDCYGLNVHLANGQKVGLKHSEKFIGFKKSLDLLHIVCRNNGLHMQLVIDAKSQIGKQHSSGLSDLILESALTAIQDCEDSVSAVDTEDKVKVYQNWLGLMRGDLEVSFEKNNKKISRTLNPDLYFTGVDGGEVKLPGRALMLVRNVGHLMTTEAILIGKEKQQAPEGIVDAMMTSLIALYDLKRVGNTVNSNQGSIYIVKPKMHGSAEVTFANNLFNKVEDALGLKRYTIKIGVMDEERRTTVNLSACINACKDRLIFINTGFLDRTGDEIHTSMEAGPMLTKGKIKQAKWLAAYENWNVGIGLACGMSGRAQIGKGMWAIPDKMKAMLDLKVEHLVAGANTSWVPSPTAATIHSMHYHQIDVKSRQQELLQRNIASLDEILSIPLLEASSELSDEEIQHEIENNAQSILGYVVRWIDQGVGCSTVPDINNVGLMEDRATLRISSQHIANWLYHGLCTEEQVQNTFKKMAVVVDEQNSGDSLYEEMAPSFQGLAFRASLALVLEGREQANGYTEPLLHQYRVHKKNEINVK